MRHILSVLSLGLFGLVGSTTAQVFNNNYYFSPSSLPNYSDVTTVKASELVNEDEIMTVGYALESALSTRHDIVIVKTKASNGAVIWAQRYGVTDLEERAYGLTVSYDGKHVMVVGAAQSVDSRTDVHGLIMKVEISTGNVVWSANYGEGGYDQELRMIERTYNGPFIPLLATYTVVGSTTLSYSKSTLYALSILDNGAQQWGNIYQETTSISPVIYDFPFTMVQNKSNDFIVTGTRYEGNQPTRIFTVGIDPLTGNLSDKYISYSIENRSHYEGAICNIDLDGRIYYGLAFTTYKPEVENSVVEAISVIILDENREPRRTYLYWQEGHPNNKGLAIYQSTENLRSLDIYTSTYRNTLNAGFLNIDIGGPVNYFLKYNIRQGDNKYATDMVQSKYGYIAKALHRDGENGFVLAGLVPTGKTECFEEERMLETNRDTRYEYHVYSERQFGRRAERDVRNEDVRYKEETCDGQPIGALEKTDLQTSSALINTFGIYPNPLGAEQTHFKLQYSLQEAKTVEITIYNALGELIHRQATVLAGGSNELVLDASALASGVNMLIIRNGETIVYQNKIIKD